MTTDTNGAGGLPRPSDAAIAKAFWELSDKAFQTPDDEWIFPVLRLISDRAGELCRTTREGDIPDGSDVLFTLRMLEKLMANGKGELADDAGCMWGVDQIAGQAIAIIKWANSRTLSRVAVQEGMVDAVADAIWTKMGDENYLFRAGSFAEAHPTDQEATRRIAVAAIAAQRQEGNGNG